MAPRGVTPKADSTTGPVVTEASTSGALGNDALRRTAMAVVDPVLDKRCRELLARVRKECPGLLPSAPPAPGEVAAVVPVDERAARALFVAAAATLTRAPASPNPPLPVVWSDGDSELLVDIGGLNVELSSGLVAVAVPVRCDQIRDAVVTITFAVGSADRPAGLLAATQDRPSGPAVVVGRWGDSLVALTWHALVNATVGVAAASGADADGVGLVPAGIVASDDRLEVYTMARPAFVNGSLGNPPVERAPVERAPVDRPPVERRPRKR
jgi:hypothetical protein